MVALASQLARADRPERPPRSLPHRAVDGHQTAEDGHHLRAREADLAEQFRDTMCTRVAANRGRDVAVGVRVAVQGEPEEGSDGGEIGEIDAAHERLGWAIEVEGDEHSAGTE